MPSSDDDSVSCSSGDPSPDSSNDSDDSEFSHGGIIKGSDESDSESGGSSDEMSADDEEADEEEEEEEEAVDQNTKELWDTIIMLIASGETTDPTNKKFLPANKKLEELEKLEGLEGAEGAGRLFYVVQYWKELERASKEPQRSCKRAVECFRKVCIRSCRRSRRWS